MSVGRLVWPRALRQHYPAHMRIKDVLAAKKVGTVVTIEPQASVRDLLHLLVEHNIGAVVVSPDGTQVTGMVSERDVVRRIAEGPDALAATVDTIMSTDVAVCDPGDSLDDLMRLMTLRRIRHVPVVQDAQLRGLVSIGDAVKTRIGELEFERDQLNQYVSGAQ
ncbi:CBS domain-containing protein [soil metagenome]